MIDQPTVHLTTAQALVRYLAAQYSSRDGQTTRLIPGFLGIFGHGNTGGIGQALDDYRDRLFFVEGRNEQGMGHTAAAYAKAMRREATLACTTSIGPGSTNLITAAAGAHMNRLPLLLIPADTYVSRRQGPILQGLESPTAGDVTVNDCFRPVSRFFDRIVRPEQLLDILPRAMRVLTDPVATGPVVLSLPQDVQVETFDFPESFFADRHWLIARPAPDLQAITDAARLLSTAKRALIVAGGGVVYSRAEQDLLAFAEEAGIPIAETFAGRGCIPSDHPLALGGLGVTGSTAANSIADTADVVICAGTRLSDFITGSQSVFQNPDVKFLGLNIDPADAAKFGAMSVVGDLRETVRALRDVRESALALQQPEGEAEGMPPERSAYLSEVYDLRDAWSSHRDGAVSEDSAPPLRQSELIGLLNDAAQIGDTVVTSAGTVPGDLFRYWQSGEGKQCHIEFGYSCMGYDIAGAIGVRLADPNGEVFALLGDATFLLSPSDLAVAVQHRLKIIVVVSDNSGMKSIRGLEHKLVNRPYANDFQFRDHVSYTLDESIDFELAQIGEALRATTYSVGTRVDLIAALDAARNDSNSSLIVVKTDTARASYERPLWWDIPVAPVSERTDVSELRDVYERGLATRRFYY